MKKFESYLYAGVGRGQEQYSYDDLKLFRRFPNQEAAQKGLRKLIRRQIETALEEQPAMPGAKKMRGLLKDIRRS
jgi:hypothetical protein